MLAVTSSAGFTPGLPYTGSLASVGVTGLTGIQSILQAQSLPLPYELAGVSVSVNGTPAPILAVADMGYYQQINIQVPAYQASAAPTMVEVSQFGQSGQLDADFFARAAFGAGEWGVFFADASGYGIIQHANYSLVTPADPAQPGEAVIAYGTNLDSFSFVENSPPIGYPAASSPLSPLIPQTIGHFSQLTVNAENAEVLYAGLTPGSVGLFQINFRVPADAQGGDLELIAATNTCSGMICPGLKLSQPVKLPVGR